MIVGAWMTKQDVERTQEVAKQLVKEGAIPEELFK